MPKRISQENLYETVKTHLTIGVHHGRFYLKTEKNWEPILPAELAVKIRHLYKEDEQKLISASAVKEIQERLLQDPYIQLEFVDDENEDYICLHDGVFNVNTGSEEKEEIGSFSYYLNFSYIPKEERKAKTFDAYISSVFPKEADVKRRLLLQILGYCLSDFTKAKAAFFFIGESNSGKSTMLELVKRILPEQTVTSIPLYRLENRFNLAKLAEARLNICSEISEKSLASADIFKMLTSNETVTAEHKGGKPFEFRLKCKSLNAGNVLPDIKGNEGIEAIINRMVLLLFPVSISREQQDLELLDKLFEERDSIFSNALDELVDLKKSSFRFIEPQDSMRVKKQLLSQNNLFNEFIQERCVLSEESKIYLKELYEAFQEYCEENLLDAPYSKTKFSQFLAQKSNLVQKKMRIKGGKPLSGIEGIRLKCREDYERESSDEKNDRRIKQAEQWNNGTEKCNNKTQDSDLSYGKAGDYR